VIPRDGATRDSPEDALEAHHTATSSPLAGKINDGLLQRPEPGPPPRGLCAVGWGCASSPRRGAGSRQRHSTALG
jgi:hypothetical protein